MNGHTQPSIWAALYWASIGLLFMSCFENSAHFFGNPECLLGWMTFSGGVLWGLWIFIRLAWKHTVYKYGNLRLCFINHLPQEEYGEPPVEEPSSQIKILPLGPQTLFIKVSALYEFPVKHINVRCLNNDKSNAPGDAIEIIDINDPYYGLRRVRDGNWGIEGEYNEARALSEGQGLYFEMNLTAHRPWNGLLSFRAQDQHGFRGFAYGPIEIRERTDRRLPPRYFPVIASTSDVQVTRIPL